jgi:hypothetical protein
MTSLKTSRSEIEQQFQWTTQISMFMVLQVQWAWATLRNQCLFATGLIVWMNSPYLPWSMIDLFIFLWLTWAIVMSTSLKFQNELDHNGSRK